LLDEPIEYISNRYVADPKTVFRLVAAAENVDLYNEFTGILVIDGIQKVLTDFHDGRNKESAFYGLLNQIGGLSLRTRCPSEPTGRVAPFIMTCVTATVFGPIQDFLADSHRKRVYLPLNRLQPPTWKNDNSLVLANNPTVRLLVNDVGGHARAMELIADELTNYPNNTPNITELAEVVYVKLKDRYSEVITR
jgi:hypothetical protein